MDTQTPTPEYKPNIYPIMYWALVYGIIAAIALFAAHLLAGFIALVWFPVFLAGVIWGGYRKYEQDKAAWAQSNGTSATPTSGKQKSPVEEFKDAARDIAQASREMMARQATEDAAAEQVEQEIITEVPEATPEEEQIPPQSPLQPLV